MKLLYLAFIEGSFPQLLTKIDQQFRAMKRHNPDTHCVIIGANGGRTPLEGLELQYVDLAELYTSSSFRSAHFTIAEQVITQLNPDIIYFRYPFFDAAAFEFSKKFPNIVYETQTIAANEVAPEDAAVERHFGPQILANAAGIVAVTSEILRHDLNRSPKRLPGYVMSNGIDPDSLPLSPASSKTDEINLLCAAQFAPWHGIDRLIEGLSLLPDRRGIRLHLAGEGGELTRYRLLVEKNGLENHVIFHGRVDSAQLEELGKICQVAIGSLALHRLGLTQFCVLKNREYCLRGIPFVYAGEDVDFSPDLPFVRVFPANDEPIDFAKLIDFALWVTARPLIREEARHYALTHLSWYRKVEGLVKFLQAVHRKRASTLHAELTNQPLVSVVIPCYNQAHFLGEAVESVVAQTYSNWECLIVNDGSTDDTSGVARTLIERYPGCVIRLVEKKNGGLPDARNAGIRASVGKYWLPLDADDKLDPAFMKKAVAVLESKPEVAFVYSDIRHFGVRNDIYPLPDFDPETMIHTDNVGCVCSLVRRSVWDDVGGYDATMREGYEDWDFWVACIEKKWHGHRIPEPLFWYRKREGSMLEGSNRKRERLMARIVVNHQSLYSERRLQDARMILDGMQKGTQTPRVLIACTHFWPSVGGVEVIAENLGAHLVSDGYRVDIATLEHPQRTFDRHRGCTILSLNHNHHESGAPLWVLQLRHLVVSGEYNACILLSNPTTNLIWAVENAPVPAHTKIIIQPIINIDDYREWQGNREFRARLGSLLRKSTAAVALTQTGVDAAFMKEEGVSPIYLPNAVDRRDSALHFRKAHNISEESFLILHVANLYRVKNHIGLLATLRRLPDDCQLVMVGHPAGEPDYIAEFHHELAHHPRVLHIPGLTSDAVAAAMAAADIVVLSSHGEVSPVCILEAMSHATPWIATPECGTVHEHAGGIVTSLDRFLPTILALKDNPTVSRQLGNAGFWHWENCYSWPRVIRGWEELIDKGTMTTGFDMPEDIAHSMTDLTTQMRQLIQRTAAVNRPPFRVIALISAHNEGDVIYHVIGDMIRQGIEVYLINHCSTDNTVAEASKWLGNGLIHIENFPQDAGYPEANNRKYVWSQILKRKEELAAQLDADWFIHSDADEFREAPWPDTTLREGIWVADKMGFSAIDFDLFNFRPVNNCFVPGTDVRKALTMYEGCENFNSKQIKAWKNTDSRVDIVSSGGHDINFEGRKVFPIKFILRHYPIRSQEHGIRKVFEERKNRFYVEERKIGWHVQYDSVSNKNHNFLHDPTNLTIYDGCSARLRLLSRDALRIANELRSDDRMNVKASNSSTCSYTNSTLVNNILRPYGKNYLAPLPCL